MSNALAILCCGNLHTQSFILPMNFGLILMKLLFNKPLMYFKNAKDDLEKYNMLLKRVFTAVILILLAVFAITDLSPLYFSTVMGLLILVGAWEWSGLIGLTSFYSKVVYAACIL